MPATIIHTSSSAVIALAGEAKKLSNMVINLTNAK